jgi:hypothetical protein
MKMKGDVEVGAAMKSKNRISEKPQARWLRSNVDAAHDDATAKMC